MKRLSLSFLPAGTADWGPMCSPTHATLLFKPQVIIPKSAEHTLRNLLSKSYQVSSLASKALPLMAACTEKTNKPRCYIRLEFARIEQFNPAVCMSPLTSMQSITKHLALMLKVVSMPPSNPDQLTYEERSESGV